MSGQNNSSTPQKEMQVLELVGGFLGFFGILLLIGAAVVDTVSGMVTNLVSAFILLGLGGWMFGKGVLRGRGSWAKPLVTFAGLALASAVAALFVSPSTSPARSEWYIALVDALRWIGSRLRGAVVSISLQWVKILTAVGLAMVAGAVWLVRRETLYRGLQERQRWRDLRLWTAVIVAAQIIIYLLLGR